MDVQVPVRKPFATEYISGGEESGALSNIFTELCETLGFLERSYQPSPSCTEQIKNLLTGSPLVSLPKTMDFSFYDQVQHEISIEQQPTYYETTVNNSKSSWIPMDCTDLQSLQYNPQPLYVRKSDRASYEENKKVNENLQDIVISNGKGSELSLSSARKRKIDSVMQDNKVQITCSIDGTPVQPEIVSRALPEQFKHNLPRIAWPSDDLPLTDDEDLDASYNLSDALLSLAVPPCLTNLKEESASPNAAKLSPLACAPDTRDINSKEKASNAKNDENIFQELLRTQQSHELGKTPDAAKNNVSNNKIPSNPVQSSATKDCRFQYVLGAATSIATKINEESLTYLNQRQSYEIKLKKLGDLSAYKGKILKTIIRICFHERRLQFMEKEQIQSWKEAHPGERILDIDVPLSYGLHRVVSQTPDNTVELYWDPMKETGIYIKVNCISTEFTAKKHGGEKGVPFRIQVETYFSKNNDNFQDNANGELLHAAFCQVRVFKLKGADRKHKQDRDKISKRSMLEQKRYKPSCECTILNNIACDLILANYSQPAHLEQSPDHNNPPDGMLNELTDKVVIVKGNEMDPVVNNSVQNSPISVRSEHIFSEEVPLCQDTNTERMSQWLQDNRFSAYLGTFSHFSGSDIWSLSREDLIQICGVPDGIRLYNSLHAKAKITPCLTFYVCCDASAPCNAVYMQTLTVAEFVHKVRQYLIAVKSVKVNCNADEADKSYLKLPFYVLGPGGIHIVLTNELISNIQEKTIFAVSVEQNGIVLKTMNKTE